MTTKNEIIEEAMENVLCITDDLKRFRNWIEKIQYDDPKFESKLYYTLKNISDTLKIYKRDIDDQLKYDEKKK